MKHFLISAAMAGIAAAAVVLASAARAETPDDQSLKAATRVLQFAAYTKGILYEAVVDGDSVVERKPADPAIDLVDFVRIKDEPCTYERRDFVPVTINGQFSRPPHGAPAVPRDHYTIWHTRIDFRRLTDEWRMHGGVFLSFLGKASICEYNTNVPDPTLSLDDVRKLISREAKLIPGGPIKCKNDVSGVADGSVDGGRTYQTVLRAVGYIHSHDCSAYEVPF